MNVFKIVVLKAYVAAEYVGVTMPNGTPFYKTTGANEVKIITDVTGTTGCWNYGHEAGYGKMAMAKWKSSNAEEFTHNPGANYYGIHQWRGGNLIVCKIGKAHTATKSVLLVPFTNLYAANNQDGTTDPWGWLATAAACKTATKV